MWHTARKTNNGYQYVKNGNDTIKKPYSKIRRRGLSRKLQILVNGHIGPVNERHRKTIEGFMIGHSTRQTKAINEFVSRCKPASQNPLYTNLAKRRSSRDVNNYDLHICQAAWLNALKELREPVSQKKRTILKLFSVPKERPNEYRIWRESYLSEFEDEITKFCEAVEQWIDIYLLQLSPTVHSSPSPYLYYNINGLSALHKHLKEKNKSIKTGPVKTYNCYRQYRATTKARGQVSSHVEPMINESSRKRKQYQHVQCEFNLFPQKKKKIDVFTTNMNPKGRGVISQMKDIKTNTIGQHKDNKKEIKDTLKENISLFISKTLDGLGYSYNMIKNRQYMYMSNDKVVSRIKTAPDNRITTGGKGEGTTMYFEHDIDYMFVLKEAVCAEMPEQFKTLKHIHLFQTKHEQSPPGYSKLELVKLAGRHYRSELRASLFERNDGSCYVSSSSFIASIIHTKTAFYKSQNGFTMSSASGPSTPFSDKYNDFDSVMSFPCYCPSVLHEWVTRPRSHGWPENIDQISAMDGHIVPVGFKGSDDQDKEWRICFSLAELHLMQNLNECQIQMYVVLKEIAKKCLQPICKDITSYIMKNVTLWMCETKHPRFSIKSSSCTEYSNRSAS